jgi:tetratricopeptide (TPR) repeat protein
MMKRPYLLFILLISYLFSNAQSGSKVDSDKLMELYQTQRYLEAAAYLQGIYKEDTTDPKELAQLAYVNMMAGKLNEAENSYLKLYAQQPGSLPVLFNLAGIASRRGDTEKARSYYSEIVNIDSSNFNAYKQLAGLVKKEISPERIKYLRRANVLNPEEADVAFSLSEFYFKMKMYGKALDILRPPLQADTANFQLLKMTMPINIALKNYNEAIKTGEKLLNYGDSSTFVINNLGKSHFLLLDYKNALKYFHQMEKDDVVSEGLLYNIGMSYRGIKDYTNAILYLQKAIKEGISDKIASYYGLIGDSYENITKNDDANRAYKKGLQFENNGSLLYNIALVYETKLGDKKNAISYYDQYLKTIDENQQPKLTVFIKDKIDELKR